MPSALYAITHKLSFQVLALTSFEKQTPADQAAWDALRDALVGEKLVIPSLVDQDPIEILADKLAIDEIETDDPSEYFDDPYRFQLVEQVGQPITPGDGTPKELDKAPPALVITVAPGTPGTITAKLSPAPLGPVTVFVFVNGEELSANLTPTVPSFTFTLAGTIANPSRHAVIAFVKGGRMVAEIKAAP